MMENTSNDWVALSDSAILQKIGRFVKHRRIQMGYTQEELGRKACLNRWTISQIENGEPIQLASFIRILRILDALYVFTGMEVAQSVSPIALAKLKIREKHRVRKSSKRSEPQEPSSW
jgi:transcriptional regulator with XRE-family HTH domain